MEQEGISIHALLAESDASSEHSSASCSRFLSTLSLRRATGHPLLVMLTAKLFLSTLSLRRATRRGGDSCYLDNIISIHALLAESDQQSKLSLNGLIDISIHALLAESDPRPRRVHSSASKFLSTLSLRRATGGRGKIARYPNDFYPRSPCGERPQIFYTVRIAINISIHALLAESDRCMDINPPSFIISIHALLAESDLH